jgi:predicted HAD superfamily phosphohydrolase YqeG
MTELDKFQIMQIITNIVQKHGCELLELDIDNQIINIDGPEEARIACAMEIEAALE